MASKGVNQEAPKHHRELSLMEARVMRPTPVEAHGTVEHEWVGSGSRLYVLSPARRISRFSPGPILARAASQQQLLLRYP